MKNQRFLVLGLLSAMHAAVDAAALNSELVINGGAEAGDTSGWISGGIDAVPAAGAAAGFGSFVFTGGSGPATQTLLQTIDLGANASAIDAGLVTSAFSIYLQSREDGGFSDFAQVDVIYRDPGNGIVTQYAFFDDLSTGPSDWNFFSDSRLVPANTRGIDILLTATRAVGVSSDGFFDEVSLQLTAVPVAPAVWLLGAGLAGLVGCRRRVEF